MGSGDREGLATFFAEELLGDKLRVALGESEARHVRVRRLAIGDRLRLVDGRGHSAEGVLVRVARTTAVVEVSAIEAKESLPEVHLLLPVADRERMLLLAEKATELGVSSWRPVLWRRSRSVSPRGEGVTFQGKVRARMISALTQSGGAWLPVHHPDAPLERVLTAVPDGPRLLLDGAGGHFRWPELDAPVTIAVGPEGGIEGAERVAILDAGFTPVALSPSNLRFETAAIVGIGLARSALTREEESRG